MTVCRSCAERPAVVCDECRRALALLDHPGGFASIARHPEQGTDCRLCERGAAELCVECLCQAVLDARSPDDSPYRAPTVEAFTADEAKAAQDRERVSTVNREFGEHVAESFYDRRPSDAGPSWCRRIGW
jgi:hypothetical protein